MVQLQFFERVKKTAPVTLQNYYTGWWFQIFFIFTPTWGRFSILTNIFRKGWKNQLDNNVIRIPNYELICTSKRLWIFSSRNHAKHIPQAAMEKTQAEPGKATFRRKP